MTPRAEPGRRRGPGLDGRLGRPARALVAVLVCVAGASGRQGAEAAASTRPHEDLGSSVARAAAPLLKSTSPGSPRMIPARDGWVTKSSLQLFRLLNPDLFPARKSAPLDPLAQAVDAIVDTQRQLARRGIDLLIVPIPSRMSVYPEALAEVEVGPDFHGFAPGLDRFHARLRARGVEVLDLLPRLAAERGSLAADTDEQVFLRVNGHWSPKGASLASQALAEYVRARPWFAGSDAFPANGERATRLETTRDIWQATDMQLPAGVEAPTLRFERVVTATGELAAGADPTSPVVLWGDSFARIFKSEGADVPRHLHHLLGAPLDVIALDAGGPYASRAAFARRRQALAGKRLVIWTFAARSLLTDQWKPVRLQRD